MTQEQAQQTTEQVYAFIRSYFEEHGFAPSLREIAVQCFMARATALRYLDRLEAQGRISRELGRARSIRLLNQPPSAS